MINPHGKKGQKVLFYITFDLITVMKHQIHQEGAAWKHDWGGGSSPQAWECLRPSGSTGASTRGPWEVPSPPSSESGLGSAGDFGLIDLVITNSARRQISKTPPELALMLSFFEDLIGWMEEEQGAMLVQVSLAAPSFLWSAVSITKPRDWVSGGGFDNRTRINNPEMRKSRADQDR